VTLLYIPLFNYFYEINLSGGHTYLTADWLINYNFGYIKRGLPGTILLYYFNNSVKLLNFITFLLSSIYILNIFLTLRLFTKHKQNYISYMLLLSPATLLFPLFDSQAAFRKEMLGFTVLLIMLNSEKSKFRMQLLALCQILFSFAIFSHEINLFFSLPILFVLKKHYQEIGIKKYILFLLPIFLNIFFYFFFSNDELTMRLIKDSICSDLLLRGLGSLCSTGIFDYIYWDFNANLNQTLFHVLNKQNQYQNYIYLFLLSFLPLIFTNFLKKNIFFLVLFGTSFVPLFFLAIDWGRWIHIIIFTISLLIFRENDKNNFNFMFFPLIFPYSFLFKIDHCCKPQLNITFENIINNVELFMSSIYRFYF